MRALTRKGALIALHFATLTPASATPRESLGDLTLGDFTLESRRGLDPLVHFWFLISPSNTDSRRVPGHRASRAPVTVGPWHEIPLPAIAGRSQLIRESKSVCTCRRRAHDQFTSRLRAWGVNERWCLARRRWRLMNTRLRGLLRRPVAVGPSHSRLMLILRGVRATTKW